MIRLIVGLIIGIMGTLAIWLIIDSTDESRQCMTQQVHLIPPDINGEAASIIIGEAVICAKDWHISNIYGPNADIFYGRIKLREWDSNEFTTE